MENTIISKALDYAKNNAADKGITIQNIADYAGFSTDYFNRVFLAHTGFTVMAYVNYIRLKRACLFLRNTDKSILDIALEVGYDSHEGFLKAFKKQYGVTPSEYRETKKNKIMYWGEDTDKSVAYGFIHENPDFQLVDSDFVIDYLLGENAKVFGYICSNIKYMGMYVAAPAGNLENGFICVGDNREGGYYLEIVTEDNDLLSQWLKRFDNVYSFWSQMPYETVKQQLKLWGITKEVSDKPRAYYPGETTSCNLPEEISIRPLSYDDKDCIVKWAGGRDDGYIRHLLREQDYLDESVLEYGVFQAGELIAVVECEIEEVHGFKFNNSALIRFAEGKASDDMYRLIYEYVVNDLLDKGLLPFDDLQFGEYAESHGGFTATDVGFKIVNHSYVIK